MSAAVKGWCPGALRPMPTGDGLLVRVRISAGRLSLDQAEALASCARDCGNGTIEVSSRGNLQLRGVAEAKLNELQARLAAERLVDADPATERVRNIVASPLSDVDPQAFLDVTPIVGRARGAARNRRESARPARQVRVRDRRGRAMAARRRRGGCAVRGVSWKRWGSVCRVADGRAPPPAPPRKRRGGERRRRCALPSPFLRGGVGGGAGRDVRDRPPAPSPRRRRPSRPRVPDARRPRTRRAAPHARTRAAPRRGRHFRGRWPRRRCCHRAAAHGVAVRHGRRPRVGRTRRLGRRAAVRPYASGGLRGTRPRGASGACERPSSDALAHDSRCRPRGVPRAAARKTTRHARLHRRARRSPPRRRRVSWRAGLRAGRGAMSKPTRASLPSCCHARAESFCMSAAAPRAAPAPRPRR